MRDDTEHESHKPWLHGWRASWRSASPDQRMRPSRGRAEFSWAGGGGGGTYSCERMLQSLDHRPRKKYATTTPGRSDVPGFRPPRLRCTKDEPEASHHPCVYCANRGEMGVIQVGRSRNQNQQVYSPLVDSRRRYWIRIQQRLRINSTCHLVQQFNKGAKGLIFYKNNTIHNNPKIN